MSGEPAIRYAVIPGFDVARVGGDFDVVSAQEIAAAFAEGGFAEPVMVLELNEVSFLDCSGIGAIVWAMRHTRARGARFTLAVRTPKVLKLLTITGLNRLIPIYPSLRACLIDDIDSP